jgi:hypothetical protein
MKRDKELTVDGPVPEKEIRRLDKRARERTR